MSASVALAEILEGGESSCVEFKGESQGHLSDNDLIEALVCLANGSGRGRRYLLVGVEDNGIVTGCRGRHGLQTDGGKIVALVSSRTVPPLSVEAEIVQHEDKNILAIFFDPPGHTIATSGGKFVRRTIGGDGKPACVPMDASDIESLLASRGRKDPSSQLVHAASWNDIDVLEIERFRRIVRDGRGDVHLIDLGDFELLKALGVIEGDQEVRGVRVAAILLFGKESAIRKYIPAHEVAFQVFDRGNLEVNDFLRWPLLRLMEEVESRFRARNSEKEIVIGMQRIGVPSYSPRSFREAVANAVVHRDYHRLGAVHIQLNDESLMISSPGGFPEGVHLNNILVTAPRPRNPLLADVLKRAGLVDRTARGIDTIYLEQLRNGRPLPSYDRSNETSVTVEIPGGAAQIGFVEFVLRETPRVPQLWLDDLLILNALYNQRRSDTHDLALLLQKSESDTRAVLGRLVERGFVEERGAKKGRTWHLAAKVYSEIGGKAAYVRQRGFDEIQQKAMILAFVEKHGKITRREVAELCRLSVPQAYRVLQELANQGLVSKVGEKGRGVHYVRI